MAAALRLVAVALAFAATATACAEQGRPPVSFGMPRAHTESSSCPLGLTDTRIGVEDTRVGADVILVSAGHTRSVRERARSEAWRSALAPGESRSGLALASLGVGVNAIEEDTESGACIHVEALDVRDLARLRVALRGHVDSVRLEPCP